RLQEVGVLDPGRLGLRGERHQDLPRQLPLDQTTLQPRITLIDLKPPKTVQVQPLRPHHLRTRVLRTGEGGVRHRVSLPQKLVGWVRGGCCGRRWRAGSVLGRLQCFLELVADVVAAILLPPGYYVV